jgi:hypothetical protein
MNVVANARNRSKRGIDRLVIAVRMGRTHVGYDRVLQFESVQSAFDLLRFDLISNKSKKHLNIFTKFQTDDKNIHLKITF